jgi:hypothetical protein
MKQATEKQYFVAKQDTKYYFQVTFWPISPHSHIPIRKWLVLQLYHKIKTQIATTVHSQTISVDCHRPPHVNSTSKKLFTFFENQKRFLLL